MIRAGADELHPRYGLHIEKVAPEYDISDIAEPNMLMRSSMSLMTTISPCAMHQAVHTVAGWHTDQRRKMGGGN